MSVGRSAPYGLSVWSTECISAFLLGAVGEKKKI